MRLFLFNLCCSLLGVGAIVGCTAGLISIGDIVCDRFGSGWLAVFVVAWLSFWIAIVATVIEWAEKENGR